MAVGMSLLVLGTTRHPNHYAAYMEAPVYLIIRSIQASIPRRLVRVGVRSSAKWLIQVGDFKEPWPVRDTSTSPDMPYLQRISPRWRNPVRINGLPVWLLLRTLSSWQY